MKLTEVVTQLQLLLPKYTDYFSETVSITSVIASGGVATFVAPNHGLADLDPVTISGIAQETPIDSVSKDGLIFTFGTTIRHDLTLNYPGYENVTLGGFTDNDWNGIFKLTDVHTRRDFKVQSASNPLPTLNGNEYLLEVRIDGVNGLYPISLIDTDGFSIAGDFADGTYLLGVAGAVKRSVRVAGSIDIQRTIDIYTKQDVQDLYAFVSMSDAISSKDRNANNDAIATFANGEDVRLRLVDGFSVFLIGNTSEELAAVEMLDVMRHDLLGPLLKSLYGARFSTGLSGEGDFRAILKGHNFVFYNRAYLVYQYQFEFTNDITISDAVEESDTRAFSELDYTQSIGGSDTTDMTFDPELPD